ncbi:TlyA family RNA methyltransferase [Leucobacter sp. W1478]|uniref:TlyA family RNA methyltransferase n=1 Tax=Leucobacter sp. W1478 TaxID=3439065 RepID=UPI003F413F4D
MNDNSPESGRAALWSGERERLDRVLPELGLARSRSQAAELIAAGVVRVDGDCVSKAGFRVASGSAVEVTRTDHYVSRAAHKLIAGLDSFGVQVGGKLALDLGASTGGFTQVLLERGAHQVCAIDVGHGQLVSVLRADSRVHVVEGCNARELTPELLAAVTGVLAAPQVVVADLSFISLTLILPAIARVAAPNADLVLLVKPQFEVGRQGVRDGIVTDSETAAVAILGVLKVAAELGYFTRGLIPSPITGGNGNQEYVVHFGTGAPADPTEWEQRIRDLTASAASQSLAEKPTIGFNGGNR